MGKKNSSNSKRHYNRGLLLALVLLTIATLASVSSILLRSSANHQVLSQSGLIIAVLCFASAGAVIIRQVAQQLTKIRVFLDGNAKKTSTDQAELIKTIRASSPKVVSTGSQARESSAGVRHYPGKPATIAYQSHADYLAPLLEKYLIGPHEEQILIAGSDEAEQNLRELLLNPKLPSIDFVSLESSRPVLDIAIYDHIIVLNCDPKLVNPCIPWAWKKQGAKVHCGLRASNMNELLRQSTFGSEVMFGVGKEIPPFVEITVVKDLEV